MTTPTPDRELRSTVARIEHRATGDKMTITGYAAVFGEAADIDGFFREVIARGAFAKSLQTADVRAFFGHDHNRVLGRSSAGTLRLSEDARGLAIEIDLPDTTDGRDLRALIERGDITGMSFGFRAVRQEWDETTNPPTRTLLEVDLFEVSPISVPAYEGTSLALRGLDDARKERRQHNFRGASRRIHLDLVARGVKVESKA